MTFDVSLEGEVREELSSVDLSNDVVEYGYEEGSFGESEKGREDVEQDLEEERRIEVAYHEMGASRGL